jgi:hypothetical protein
MSDHLFDDAPLVVEVPEREPDRTCQLTWEIQATLEVMFRDQPDGTVVASVVDSWGHRHDAAGSHDDEACEALCDVLSEMSEIIDYDHFEDWR